MIWLSIWTLRCQVVPQTCDPKVSNLTVAATGDRSLNSHKQITGFPYVGFKMVPISCKNEWFCTTQCLLSFWLWYTLAYADMSDLAIDFEANCKKCRSGQSLLNLKRGSLNSTLQIIHDWFMVYSRRKPEKIKLRFRFRNWIIYSGHDVFRHVLASWWPRSSISIKFIFSLFL